MDFSDEGVKTKTLAVFQNVVTKEKQKKRKKFRPHRFSDDDSSQSESELVIDDEPKEEVTKRKKSSVRIRFKEENLELKCDWDGCSEIFDNTDSLYRHLVDKMANIIDNFDCRWANCPNPTGLDSTKMLIRHVAYHLYLAKLINMGKNILERNILPDCKLEPDTYIAIGKEGYVCEWKECSYAFNTIYEFFTHVACHVNAAPTGKNAKCKRENEEIPCLWSGCSATFSTRYKLGDHMKLHTKERMVACPKCISLFATKTSFCDHRKRQLKTRLRSYQCSQCLRLYSSERILSDHMRAHIHQYKCTLCDMTSTKPSTLAKHYRYRHMNERLFKCQQCEKTFVTKSNLNTHLLTHQDKPFKCEQCEFGCKSKVGLSNHVLKVHGMEKPSYECQVCKHLFKRGDYLTAHLIKFHKFHWPSGHSRFRYRKDLDGICRLQTVRYESLEVTEEMIRSESMNSTKNPTGVTYNITYDNNAADGYRLTVVQEDEVKDMKSKGNEIKNQEILISIEDLDDEGNVIKTQTINSTEITFISPQEITYSTSNN